MTADTLKTTRVLELYQDFLSGKLINKQQAAEQYHVNVRSIQRDIDSMPKKASYEKSSTTRKKMATVWSHRRSSSFPKVRFWLCARFCWKAEPSPENRWKSSCKSF